MERRDFLYGALATAGVIKAGKPVSSPGHGHHVKPPPNTLPVTVPDTGNPVTNGTNLQAAINAATWGAIIVVQGGATYQGNFTLPNKGTPPTGTSADVITITTNRLSNLPASLHVMDRTAVNDVKPVPSASQRSVLSAAASDLAKLVGETAAIVALQANGQWYKLVGLDISNLNTGGNTYTTDLVQLGVNGSGPGGALTYAEFLATGNTVIDRCFIHPQDISAATPTTTSTSISAGRGILVQGSGYTIQNSWIGGFGGTFNDGTPGLTDSYGIYMPRGMSMTLTNNYIEAWFNCVFLGGGTQPGRYIQTVSASTVGSITVADTTGLAVGTRIGVRVPDANATDGNNPPGGLVDGHHNNVQSPPAWRSTEITGLPGGGVVNIQNPYIGPSGLNGTAPLAPAGQAIWGFPNIGPVTMTRNTFAKQYAWATNATLQGGAKDYIEVKSADGLTIDGNMYAGPAAFAGIANAHGTENRAPWNTVRNVTISNNLFAGPAMLNFSMVDSEQTGTIGDAIVVTNNLFLKATMWSADGSAVGGWKILNTYSGTGITFTHNTVRNVQTAGSGAVERNRGGNAVNIGDIDNSPLYGQSLACAGMVVRDNIMDFGGPVADGYAGYLPANTVGGTYASEVAAAWPSLTDDYNVMIDRQHGCPAGIGDPGMLQCSVPWGANDVIVQNDSDVGFVDVAGADAGGDYHGYALTNGSAYHHAASDGTDVGVNFATLDSALGV